MSKIKGITVKLITKEEGERDAFGHPTVIEKTVEVENVLVAPSSSSDILSNTSLDGHKMTYTLAIPKGDTNSWENGLVEFFGLKWHVIGMELLGIVDNIPLAWNKKVTVETYE